MAFIALPAHAGPAALIEAGDGALRSDLQWLIDHDVIEFSASTWPISHDALKAALVGRRRNGLTAADVAALASVQRAVARHGAAAGVTLRANNRAQPQLGFDETTHAKAEASTFVQGESGPISGRLQVNGLYRPLTGAQDNGTLEGSYLSAALLGQIVYAGQLDRWWGPGNDGSLIWSNAGTAIAGVGLRRGRETAPSSALLSWIGPWGYDVSVGRLVHYASNPGTRVFSMRLYARPLRGLELGASRFVQWGDNGGLPGLGDALIGRANSPDRAANNEIAGFDLRYHLPVFGNPLTLYGQAIGEDEAGAWPAKYIGLVGAEYKHAWGDTRMQWHVEAADSKTRRLFQGQRRGTPNVAYRHSQYTDGLYQDGLPIALAIGGDGRSISAGLTVVPASPRYNLRYRFGLLHADVNESNQRQNQAFPTARRYVGGEFGMQWNFNRTTWRLAGRVLHGTDGRNMTGVGLSVEVPF